MKPQPDPFRARVISHDTVHVFNSQGALVFVVTCDQALAVQDERCLYCFQRSPGGAKSCLALLQDVWASLDLWKPFESPPALIVEGAAS